MEHEADKGNDKHVRINFEVSYKEAEPLTWGSTDSSSSSDSSSLELSFGKKDFLSNSHLEPEQTGHGHGMQKGISSPKASAPVQVMDKPSGYDPNRIPAFVFSSKPAAAMEWSVASNESLFSLHMGNNSFSKDLPILLAKSQELGMFDEVANFPFSLPPVTEASCTERETAHSRKSSGGTEASTDSSVVVSMETSEEQRKQNLPPSMEGRKSAASSHSDGLAGEEQSNFVKMEADWEKQKSQPQTPRATSKAAGSSSWFSCFSCFSCRPRCC